MRFLFAGGGTGGHIFPAIAIADSIRAIEPDSEILFIGSKGRLEEKIVPANNYEIKIIELHGLNRKKIFSNLNLPSMIWKSISEVKKIIKDFNPDAVIGTGGYVSAPLLYAAGKMNIPIFMQEGNAIPGKVTKMFSKKAKRIFINLIDSKSYLKNRDNIIQVAHPIRFSKGKILKREALKYFNFEEAPTLFVFGGSQGARAINSGIAAILEKLIKLKINIIWQTGRNDYQKIKALAGKFENKVKVFDFINEMNISYSASDLVICRAGISSIMELAALRMPSILIPYIYAAENHQEKNALALSEKDACILLKEKDIENNLYNTISEVIFDNERLKELGNNISKFSDSESALKIAKEILKCLKYGK